MARRSKSTQLDLSDPQVRAALMEGLGIERPKPKANVLSRIGSALNAFETGNAAYTGFTEGNIGAGLKQYASDVFGGLKGAVTGDVDREKKTYSDVIDMFGGDNKLVKGVGGFGLDVLLDPTTYVSFGTGAGAKVGGKTLTKAGEKIFTSGIKKAEREIARKGIEEFAAKEGLNMLNKGSGELAREFAEKRLFKFSEKTGGKFFKDLSGDAAAQLATKSGSDVGEDLFQKEAIRFGAFGKTLFEKPIGGGFTTGLKSYFDPISTGAEMVGKTRFGKAAGEGVKSAFAGVLQPIRRVFSRSAEIAGDANIERQYKDLIGEVINMQDMARFEAAGATREAKQFFDKLRQTTDTPEAFPYLFEQTPPELLRTLPDELQSKIANMSNQIKNMTGQAQVPTELVQKVGLDKAGEQISNYKKNLVKAAELPADPIKESFGIATAPLNANNIDELITSQRERSQVATRLLQEVGALDDTSVVDYLMRKVEVTPEGKITDFKDSDAFKKRAFQYLAELESAGGITSTTGKVGDKAASKIADLVGRQQLLVAKASRWKDLENKIADMVDVDGGKITYMPEEIGEDLMKSGMFKQVKSDVTGKVLFNGAYLPKEAADLMQKTHRTFFGDKGTNDIVKIFDKVNNFWKGSVTAWFPAFHVRNGASNIFTNAMAGVTNPAQYAKGMSIQKFSNKLMEEGMDSAAVREMASKKMGKTGLTIGELLNVAEKNGIIGSGTYFDELADKLVKGEGKFDKFKQFPSNIGNAIESNAKLAHFIDKLEKGFSIGEAATSTKKYLFDYGDLTDFEKNVMRRIFPFYTWVRKNMELQLKEMAVQPGKYATVLKSFRDIENAFSDLDEEEVDNLPDWVQKGVKVVTGEDGQARVITSFGTPIEAFSSALGGFAPGQTGESTLLSSTNPIMKFLVENATNRDLFSGKDLDKNTSAKQYKNIFSKLPPELQQQLGYKEIERTTSQGDKYTEYRMNSNAKQLINLLFSRAFATAGKASSVGEDGAVTPDLVDLLSGVKQYDFDLNEESARREQEQKQLLLEALEKQGLAKEYSTINISKADKKRLSEVVQSNLQ